MTEAEKILADMPSIKIGLDDYYGRQTVLNALNKALSKPPVVGQSEQLKCPNCELNYDKEEIEMFRGLCESCRDRAF